jgi:Ser/Thr protein kinase RdoA (MazF antagonist)
MQIDGRNGLVMERVDGVDGLTAAMQKPWRIWSIGRGIGRLHRRLSQVTAPVELPAFSDRTRLILEHPPFPDTYRARLLALLESAPSGAALCHMDFHPGNIMETARGPVVIDFANAQSGHPLCDHIQSLLLLTVGVPAEVGFRERMLILAGRKLITRAYRSGYGKVDKREFARLRPLVIAQRMADRIPEELPGLERMLPEALAKAEAL